MFDRIKIVLSGPICGCAEERLEWFVSTDDNGKACMNVKCKLCNTRLHVGAKEFMASFELGKPYPGTKLAPKPKPKLEVLPGGKLIPFPVPAPEPTG